MRVFVFEYMTGCWSDVREGLGPGAKSLLAEGTAMAAAVAADFLAAGHEVLGVRDRDLCDLPPPLDRFRSMVGREGSEAFGDAAERADYILLIVPETERKLYYTAACMELEGNTLLGPPAAFIEWATDKHATAERLRAAGVRAPRGVRVGLDDRRPRDFPSPAVLKPIDGCGSQDIRRVDDLESDMWSPTARPQTTGSYEPAWRLEEFVPGRAASVAVLRGPGGNYVLPPCAQNLADDRTFAYRGGSCPLEPPLAERACDLAERAVQAMPSGHGYIGIDLVLGAAEDGSQDYVIEVNPRLTTSYVGLRALAETNLAAAMIDVVEGRKPELSFRPGRVDFTADGQVRRS